MIELYTLAPERLNLNGDQANLLVLSKRLEWLGESVKIVSIDSLADISALSAAVEKSPERKFLLLGHGSNSAWKSLEPLAEAVRELVATLVAQSVPVLAVGSGYELLRPGAPRTLRRSDFNVSEFEGREVLGYRNTDAQLPELARDGSLLLTLLHGPLLAKNPQLADEFIEQLGVVVKANDRTEEIDAIVTKAWELEATH
jgi:CobQ-like glutamine amidotransferase family enzyme